MCILSRSSALLLHRSFLSLLRTVARSRSRSPGYHRAGTEGQCGIDRELFRDSKCFCLLHLFHILAKLRLLLLLLSSAPFVLATLLPMMMSWASESNHHLLSYLPSIYRSCAHVRFRSSSSFFFTSLFRSSDISASIASCSSFLVCVN